MCPKVNSATNASEKEGFISLNLPEGVPSPIRKLGDKTFLFLAPIRKYRKCQVHDVKQALLVRKPKF